MKPSNRTVFKNVFGKAYNQNKNRIIMGILQAAARNWRYGIMVILIGIAAGLPLKSAGWVALAGILLLAAWLAYSRLLSNALREDLGKVLRDDALTYLPLALLAIMPIIDAVNLSAYGRYQSIPSRMLMLIAFSSVAALKAWKAGFRASSGKIVWAGVAVYIAAFAALSIGKHYSFHTGAIDLGIFDQTLWGLMHGKIIFSTVVGDYLFANHSFIILFPIALLYWIWSSPVMLLLLQTAILGLGALPVYWIARSKLKHEHLAAAFGLAYLLYPALQYMNLADFHPEVLATPITLFAIYFFEKNSRAAFISLAVVALAAKENIALAMAPFGLYIAALRKKVWLGLLIFLLSAAFLAFNLYVFMPHFAGGNFALRGYGSESSLPEIIMGILNNPIAALGQILQLQKIAYIALLLIPLGLGAMALAAPEVLLIASPALLSNMLSSAPQRASIFFQYNDIIVPFVFYAAIIGMRRIMAYRLLDKYREKLANSAAALLIASGILGTILIGPLAYTPFEEINPFTQHAISGREMLALTPEDASVSATNNAAAHLSEREKIYVFPNPFHKVWYLTDENIGSVDYVLVDLVPGREGIYTQDEFESYVNELLSNREYGLAGMKDSWMILKRGADFEKGLSDYKTEIQKEKFIKLPSSSENGG
jgi:uncharacterized membrane protein